MDLLQIGRIVKYHRKVAGLSQKELADLAGVGKTVVFDLEKGKLTMQWKTITSILNALNISIDLNSPLMDKYLEDEKS